MKNKDLIINIIGILFILIGFISTSIYIYVGNLNFLFWFCNHVSFVLGIAFLFRNRFIITAELSIGLIPQLIWSIDFLSKLIFNRFIFGATEYMFQTYNKLLFFVGLNHLFVMLLALYGLYLLGNPGKKAWVFSFVHGFFLLVPAYIQKTNINCALRPCLELMASPYYRILWIIIMIIVILLTNYLLVKFVKKN